MTTATASANRAGKYLTFVLGHEGYGIEILKVLEIFGCMEITAIPRTPHYVKGVLNLRGQVISVVDLRLKFGMEEAERTEETCIIVVETTSAGRKVSIGLIVDKVSEVMSIAEENIEDAPSFGTPIGAQFILGIGKTGSSVKILLDIDKALDTQDLSAA